MLFHAISLLPRIARLLDWDTSEKMATRMTGCRSIRKPHLLSDVDAGFAFHPIEERQMETPAIALKHHAFRANGSRQAVCGPACDKTNAAMDGSGASVWDHVIHALLGSYRSDGAGKAYLARPASRGAAYAPSSHVQVEVIERLSDTSISVLWQDATRCRYIDQVWISCRARQKGCCALSGAVISRDDPIYKPRVRAATPANASAMILASVIERLPAMAMTGDSR